MKIYLNLLVLIAICSTLHSMENIDNNLKSIVDNDDNSSMNNNIKPIINSNDGSSGINNDIKPIVSNNNTNNSSDINNNLNQVLTINNSIQQNNLSNNNSINHVSNDKYYGLDILTNYMKQYSSSLNKESTNNMKTINTMKMESYDTKKCYKYIVEQIVKNINNNTSLGKKIQSIIKFMIHNYNEDKKYNNSIITMEKINHDNISIHIFKQFLSANLNVITLFKIIDNKNTNLLKNIKQLEQYFYNIINQRFCNLLKYALYDKPCNKMEDIKYLLPEIGEKLQYEMWKQNSYLQDNNYKLQKKFYSNQLLISICELQLTNKLLEGFDSDICKIDPILEIGNLKAKTFLNYLETIKNSISGKNLLNNVILKFIDTICKDINYIPDDFFSKKREFRYDINYDNLDDLETKVLYNLKVVANKEQEQLLDLIICNLNKFEENYSKNNNFWKKLYNELNEPITTIITSTMKSLLNTTDNYSINPKVTNIDTNDLNCINFGNKNCEKFSNLLNNINNNKQIRLLQLLDACIFQIKMIKIPEENDYQGFTLCRTNLCKFYEVLSDILNGIIRHNNNLDCRLKLTLININNLAHKIINKWEDKDYKNYVKYTTSIINEYLLDIYRDIVNNLQNDEKSTGAIVGITNEEGIFVPIEELLNKTDNNIKNLIQSGKKEYCAKAINIIFNDNQNNSTNTSKIDDENLNKETITKIEQLNNQFIKLMEDNKQEIQNIILNLREIIGNTFSIKFLQGNLREDVKPQKIIDYNKNKLVKIIDNNIEKYINDKVE